MSLSCCCSRSLPPRACLSSSIGPAGPPTFLTATRSSFPPKRCVWSGACSPHSSRKGRLPLRTHDAARPASRMKSAPRDRLIRSPAEVFDDGGRTAAVELVGDGQKVSEPKDPANSLKPASCCCVHSQLAHHISHAGPGQPILVELARTAHLH